MSFLDQAPLDWTNAALLELRGILVQAYPEEVFAKQICEQAGLASKHFPIRPTTMRTLWHAAMNTLAGGKLRRLVVAAKSDPLAERWHSRLDDMLCDEPATQPESPASAGTAGWWKGRAETRAVRLQRQLQQRARYTSVRVARQVGDLARSVAYLDLRFGAHAFHGTGFLIAPDRILTNHHNVVHAVHGKLTRVEIDFDHEEGCAGPELVRRGDVATIVPDEADERDWAVIRLEAPVSRAPLALGSSFETHENDTVIIIQHPLGSSKQFTIDYLSVRHADDDVVQYSADTQKGSSGAPVFNTRMHLIALHHAEVEVEQSTANGKTEIVYRNEGVRIERVMEGLAAANVPFTKRA